MTSVGIPQSIEYFMQRLSIPEFYDFCQNSMLGCSYQHVEDSVSVIVGKIVIDTRIVRTRSCLQHKDCLPAEHYRCVTLSELRCGDSQAQMASNTHLGRILLR